MTATIYCDECEEDVEVESLHFEWNRLIVISGCEHRIEYIYYIKIK